MLGLDKDNIADFLENFVDTGVKITAEANLFENDELLSAVPYGKILSYVTKKVIQIKDPNEALKKAVLLSIATNFIRGVEKYNFDLKIKNDPNSYKESLALVKENLNRYKCDVKEFDLNNFSLNDIIIKSVNDLNYVFDKYFDHDQKIRLVNYRNDHLKVDFLNIIEEQSTTYEKLNNVFKSRSYEEYKSLYRVLKYREFVKNLYNDVVLNDEAGMTLADIYIEPNFRVHEYCIDKQYLTEKSKDPHFEERTFHKISYDTIHEFIYDILNGVSDYRSLKDNNSNLIFVLGYPGQGKSSFCKKILNDAFVFDSIENKNLLFVKIRNITDTVSLVNDPIQVIYEHWMAENGIEEKDFLFNDIQSSFIILDGLDELFMKENLSSLAIDDLCRAMLRKTEQYPNIKILVTSRYGYVNLDILKKTHALIIQLEEFYEMQQIDWLNKYKVFHPETNLTEKKIKKYNEDNSFRSIKELITQPILLHLIATLNEEIDQKTNKAIIYDRLFTELINRSWAKEGQIDNLIGLEKEDLREFIRNIAYIILVSGREYIHKSQLIELPQTKNFIKKLYTERNVRDVLKNIMIAFYFQETKKSIIHENEKVKNDYAIEFLHKSLQEYLVAEKIWDDFQIIVSKEDRRSRYIIDDSFEALKKIDESLPNMQLSMEIGKNLVEIINNADLSVRQTMANRIELFLPDWINNGFVSKLNWGEDNYDSKNKNNIYNIFLVLTNLVEGRNYLKGDILTKFFSDKNLNINLRDQTLLGDIEDAVKNGDDFFTDGILGAFIYFISYTPNSYASYKVEFNSVYLHSSALNIFDPFLSLKFNNCILYFVRISGNSITKGIEVEHSYIYNVDFPHGEFSFKDTILQRCNFGLFSNNVYVNCKITMCTFYIKEDFDRTILDGNILEDCAFIVFSREKYPDYYGATDSNEQVEAIGQ